MRGVALLMEVDQKFKVLNKLRPYFKVSLLRLFKFLHMHMKNFKRYEAISKIIEELKRRKTLAFQLGGGNLASFYKKIPGLSCLIHK